MIPREELRKIKKLHMKTAWMVDHIIKGQYHSVFRGNGMEFEEVREYRAGDDVRSIDWKVSARMGEPFIKVFKEERELSLMIMVDISSSGFFGSHHSMKIEKAAEMAAVCAYLAVKNNDRAGLIIFSDKIELYLPPGKGQAHVWKIIKSIYEFKPVTGLKTDIGKALEFFMKVSSGKNICFLISDFISPPFTKELKKASSKHEIIAVQIEDKNDLRVPGSGVAMFTDPETGEDFMIDLGNKKIRSEWEKKAADSMGENKKVFKSSGVDLVSLYTDQSSADQMIKYFKKRNLRKY